MKNWKGLQNISIVKGHIQYCSTFFLLWNCLNTIMSLISSVML